MIELITIAVAIVFFAAIKAGVRFLPHEKWQFVATIPITKNHDGSWNGLNLTYYGVITATSYVLAVVIFYFLALSQQVPVKSIVFFVVTILSICMPAAKLIALVVEKKRHTFSVGGASFAGIIAAPLIIYLYKMLAPLWHERPVSGLSILAAISIAYAFGEGFGRLACLSFGCCYGKPLADAPVWLQRACFYQGLIFTGKTKKVSYAHDLDGQPLIPVQVMTAYLYTFIGVLGFYLFLKGWFGTALLLTLAVTQIWRLLSEFLRADHRGSGRISAYQVMSVAGVFYVALVVFLLPADAAVIAIEPALKSLWSPMFIVSMQALWLLAFLYCGRSQVTIARVNMSVLTDRI